MLSNIRNIEDWQKRGIILSAAVAILVLVYLFQHLNYIAILLGQNVQNVGPKTVFSINKTIRFIINDTMTVLVIYAVFYNRKYVVFAIAVQVFGLLVLLPTYLVFKWHYPGYNGPMINYLHRLTLNPVLLMMLIPVFMFQRKLRTK